LACQDELFVNNPLDVKENYEHALDFTFHLSRTYSVSVSSDFPSTAHAFFPERSSNHCQDFLYTFSEIFAKFDAVLMYDPPRNLNRPDTRLQVIESKKIRKSIQLCKIVYTDSQDTLALSSTVASRYYNYCTDGSTSPGNYEYPVVEFLIT
jgi:hypothetical protein